MREKQKEKAAIRSKREKGKDKLSAKVSMLFANTIQKANSRKVLFIAFERVVFVIAESWTKIAQLVQ